MPAYAITAPIAQAIAQMEGFNTPGSLAAVNRNPGNIRVWLGGGRDTVNRGYVVFPSLDEGWRALYHVVDDYIRGRYHGGQSPTLLQMFATYAPTADSNDPAHYARFVSARVGLPLDVPLAQLAGGGGGGGGGGVTPVPSTPVTPSYLPPMSGLEPTEITDDTLEVTLPYVIAAGAAVLLLVLILS